MTRRTFAKLTTTAAGTAFVPLLTLRNLAGADEALQSEFLLDLVIDGGPPHQIGADRLIVPVTGGTFEGPKLKGTLVSPGGDWITRRSDGTAVLDARFVLQTDDAQKISMTVQGINYTPPGGTQYVRILSLFQTGAAKYDWLNHIVAVGVYRPVPGKIAHRVYRIL
jgi:hypothetical protein